MKVLSIREPFATLIANNIKHIETRSWKTNYRGELFIHASGKSLSKDFSNSDSVFDLVNNMQMNYGNIICKCKLVDCVYMDDEFITTIMKDPIEYEFGDYKVGRYAWVLEDVELIYPISVKGRLGIWNYDGKYKLM